MNINNNTVSDRRKVAIQAENKYYVQKINELQSELEAKKTALNSTEDKYSNFDIERDNFEQEIHSLRKMIELLNR
jgi:uncharacterized protein (DUF3084 family)